MKLKKYAAPMLAGFLAATIAVTSTASAHPYDYWQGKYIGMTNVNIVLKVMNSAQTDILSKDNVYKYATNWNNISSNVKVSVVYEAPGMPTIAGQMSVVGKSYDNGTLGRTKPYDSNGNLLDTTQGYNSNWAYVLIEMNIDPIAFWGSSAITTPSIIITNAKKTFLHEVGHALKLSHPEKNWDLSGHTESYGRPYAIMNQGYVNANPEVIAADIVYHDKSCLIAKWGA